MAMWLALLWDIPRVVWVGYSPDGKTLAALLKTDARLPVPVRALRLWDIP